MTAGNGNDWEAERPTRPDAPQILEELFVCLSESRELNQRISLLLPDLENLLPELKKRFAEVDNHERRLQRLESLAGAVP